MLIARLLTPKEIGVFSVAASLIGIAHTLRDFGVSNYLIQVKDLSIDKVRTAFTITAIMAWLIAALLFLSKGLIAEFYNKTELQDIVLILGLNFVILPFSSITMALLRRDMEFGKIYRITILGAISQATVNVALARLGFGSYSLAWGGFANVLITALAAQFIMPNYAYFKPSLAQWRAITDFGGKLSVSSLVFEAGNYSPDIIMGKLLGFVSVGIFSRAMGFVSLIDQALGDAIRPVMLPYFSQKNRECQDIRDVFLKVSSYYLSIALPLLCLIALLADPMIRLLYGSQWDIAVPIAQILCLAMMFKSLNFLVSAVILAGGYAGRVLKVQLIYQPLRVFAIFYGGLQSLNTIAYALVVAELIGFFVFYSQLKISSIKLISIIKLFLSNLIVALLAIFPVFVVNIILINKFYYINNFYYFFAHDFNLLILSDKNDGLGSLYCILISSTVMLFSWLFTVFLFHRCLWNDAFSMFKIKFVNK
jgi:O-antigen/teichoic acid export membrane protein